MAAGAAVSAAEGEETTVVAKVAEAEVTGAALSSAPAPVEEEHEEPSAAPRMPPSAPPPVSAQRIPEPVAAAEPIIVPPAVAPAPMSIDDLRPVLEQAGLTLVQTEPSKLADVLARFSAEVKPVRVPRERPVLPPLDTGPLLQVETRRTGASPP